jgi:hypothetical protein
MPNPNQRICSSSQSMNGEALLTCLARYVGVLKGNAVHVGHLTYGRVVDELKQVCLFDAYGESSSALAASNAPDASGVVVLSAIAAATAAWAKSLLRLSCAASKKPLRFSVTCERNIEPH